ncbi:MAG: lamin tail domain-containing protein [Candidatus Micrarchaeota archaeon]
MNLELAEQGYAHSYFYSSDEKKRPEIENAESAAIGAEIGIWQRSETACIAVFDFHYDAEDDDSSNLNDEYVILENNCSGDISMLGWTAKDRATNMYTFGNFTLRSGDDFVLRTGCGQNSSDELYWCSSGAVWNNDEDALYLRDGEGKLAVYAPYKAE